MLTLELPIPPKPLQPNGRAHYYTKHKYSKQAKSDGWAVTREQVTGNPFTDGPLFIRYTYHPPAPRGKYLDDDNLIGAMKYYRDGIALALGVDDKVFMTQPVQHGKKAERGKVVVEIWQDSNG